MIGFFNKILYFSKVQTDEHAEPFTHSQFHARCVVRPLWGVCWMIKAVPDSRLKERGLQLHQDWPMPSWLVGWMAVWLAPPSAASGDKVTISNAGVS